MGVCVKGRTNIVISSNEEINKKYTAFVDDAASSRNTADIIVASINSGDFVKTLSSDESFMKESNGNIFNLKGHVFKKYVRKYERQVMPSVTTFAYDSTIDNKYGFDTYKTKADALDHTADLIIDIYYKLAFNKGVSVLKGKNAAYTIKENLTNSVLQTLAKRAINYAEELNNDDIKNTIAENYNNIIKYRQGISNARKNLTLAKQSKNADDISLWRKRLENVTNKYNSLIEDFLLNTDKLFDNNATIENQNYLNLVKNIIDNKEWFNEVTNLSKLFNIRETIKELSEQEKANAIKEYSEYNLDDLTEEDELYSFDASTANWNNSLYNNFLQHYDGRLKLYFNTIPVLKTTTKLEDGQYRYKTDNNKLGVAERMNASFVISQLLTFGNFASINSFIKSVEDIAENIPGLAGLIKLADDMKANRDFANMVASNLAKPVILKNMLIFDGMNFNLIHSNPNANIYNKVFNKLFNISKISITTDYDDSVDETVTTFLYNIDKVTNPNDFVNLRDKIFKFINSYFDKYFPGINSDVIYNYYYTSNNQKTLNRAKELLNIVNEFNESIKFVRNSITQERERVRRTNAAKKAQFQEKLGIIDDTVAIPESKLVKFNPDAINYNPVFSVIGKLSKIIAEHSISITEYNSGNAENNMSSDVVKNSYLTNFMQQLKYVIEDENGNKEERGITLLKEFLTKKGTNKTTSFYEYSPVLFGIRNPLWKKNSKEPKYLREGLFIKEGNGEITINPRAKELINIILYNGAKNTNIRVGQLYQNMSRSDYFTSIVTSYFSPINYNREYGDGTKNAIKDYAQVLLRIPSDASNQYAVQMQKFTLNNFYNYDNKDVENFINKLINPYISPKGKKSTFSKKVADNINDDVKLSVIFEKANKSIINIDTALSVLYNGGIYGTVNTYGYYKINDGQIIPLFVKDGINSFIIYLKSDNYTWKSGTDYEIDRIETVSGTTIEEFDDLLNDTFVKTDYLDVETALRNYLLKDINKVGSFAFNEGKIKRNYNKNSVIYRAFKQELFGEINNLFNALSDVFESIEDADGNIHYVTKTTTKGLFDYYHYDPKKGIVENDKLTGEVFTIKKLFDLDNYSASENIKNILNFYGENGLFKKYDDNRLELNLDRTDIINSDLSANITNMGNMFDEVLSKWLDNYFQYIENETNKYGIVKEYYSDNQIQEALVNQTLAYMEFDDLFEGSSKFYKDAQTFLKRDKEIQAGGQNYMGLIDISDNIGAPIHNINDENGNTINIQILNKSGQKEDVKTINFENGKLSEGVLTARNGFRAVTISNTATAFDTASEIYNKIYERLINIEHQTEENAKKIAKTIADGYGFSGEKTKINDAQSYITIEEFIRRKWADGTISEYGNILSKVLDENYKLTKDDYAEIARKIQVQKNFYYDIAFDENTGLYYPRQIKNAEFVLIPRFIKGSSLEELYNIMKEKDINQINTIETSKAANVNVLEFWDNNGNANANKFKKELINNANAIQTYYYRYLYKQQDVVDHIDDEENKAGIQLLKKIQDNIVYIKTNVEAQLTKELNDIKEKAIADGTFMKAPNGKPTNLNEKQWLQVRTKAFKNWFGDWENNPSEASKVIDENGEPLVVWHSSNRFFNKFDLNYGGKNTGAKDGKKGFFFMESKSGSKWYSSDLLHNDFRHTSLHAEDIWNTLMNNVKVVWEYYDSEDPDYIKIYSNGIVVTGDESHKDISDINNSEEFNRFPNELISEVLKNIKLDTNISQLSKKLNDAQQYLEAVKEHYDVSSGAILNLSSKARESIEDNFVRPFFLNIKNIDFIKQNTERKKSILSDIDSSIISNKDGIKIQDTYDSALQTKTTNVYVAFNPNQIKSATDNSGLFSKTNNDVYDNDIYDSVFNKSLEAVKTIQNNLTENIIHDYQDLMDECGWTINNKGQIVNKSNNSEELNFKTFYTKARQEAARLGMDSNFLDYITPDENGRIVMPTFMNNASSKLESIAQSVFNNSIVRQKLPGFHAVQVSNVGTSRKLKYHITDEGVVVEVMVAPWNKEIKDIIAKYGKEEALKQLQNIGADEIIGYRIPTEGKQSIIKMKVVDFLDESQGSTIILSDEWVAQSGSDFDVDTIYSIVHELQIIQETKTHKEKIIEKTAEGKDFEIEKTISENKDILAIKEKGRAGRNNQILEAFKTILSDIANFEENMSRSNFDNISSAIDKYNPIKKNASVYDPITQVQFMQNAIDGRKLKAFSVNRDTFCSISNTLHSILKDSNITVIYDLSKIDKNNLIVAYGKENVEISKDGTRARVTHNKIGWSNNNRNVVGALVTTYSSQTTAHILDAIKKGVIFNETDYTFGSFKTLIDLGVDYDTAVSFLAQQAITDLNEEYFKVNSVFNNTYPTVLENVYRNFAKKYGFTFDGNVINNYMSFKNVMTAIETDKTFVKNYIKYWGLKKFKDIPSLSEKRFNEELKNPTNNKYHYFGVLQIFSNLKQQTDIIEDIAQCSRPDATGAKQTVRATRKLLDNIKEYASDEDVAHKNLITTTGNKFLVDLYGLNKEGDIIIENSKYKYLAAILKYGVETSVKANKKLFAFASDEFDTLSKYFEERIGRELTEEEFNQFKKYYVSGIYSGIELINSPIILDSNNNIISNPDYGIYGPNFWDTERSRVFGYVEPHKDGDNFKVKNFTNPTKDEIKEYSLLTPLQKVYFIQKALKYDDNIFNKLYISKISDRNYKEKGYTNNKITINVDNANIESLYTQFERAIFNKNPLIRLAAIDLVKYAMLVEGYNYKNGAITKIIHNRVLYTSTRDKGLDIIERINKDFTVKLDNSDAFCDKFIRSHSELIRSINIESPSSEKDKTTIGDVLNLYREKIKVYKTNNNGKSEIVDDYSGVIHIPVENETKELRNFLKLNNDKETPFYMRINSAISATDKKEIKLYKVIPIIAPALSYEEYKIKRDAIINDNKLDEPAKEDLIKSLHRLTKKQIVTQFYLIPLNLLEENEYADISINNDNNNEYNYDFFKALHPIITTPTDIVSPIIYKDGVIYDEFNRPTPYVRNVKSAKNPETIEKTANAEKDSVAKTLAKYAKEQIVNWYTNDRVSIKGAENFGIIQVNGNIAFNVLGIDSSSPVKESIQDIVVDDLGTTLTVRITPLNGKTYKKLNSLRKGKNTRDVSDYIKSIYNNKNLYWGESIKDDITGFYTVTPIINASNESLLENEENNSYEKSPDQLFSKFRGIFNEISTKLNNVENIDEVHDISTLVIKELQYQKTHGNDEVADELKLLSIKGFVPNDSTSLENYKVDIYKIAAKHYRNAADRIIQKLERFECNGSVYSIDDPELYDALREDPKKVNELYHLLLEASTFGNQVFKISEQNFLGEDDETTKNIQKIQRAIRDVKNNTKVHKAFDYVYNIYLAKEYVSNPLVKLGIVAMTDIFGDSDWFAANIGDVAQLNHKQIQVVTKLATQELQKARLTAADEIADFEKWWNEKEKDLGTEGMKETLNKIIDKDGKFIQPYIKQYIEDKIAWNEKLKEAEKFGKTSLKYLELRHKRDKWYLNNVNQEFIKEYYQERYNNDSYALKNCPKEYSDYLTLEQQYYGFKKFVTLTTEQKKKKTAIAEAMSNLRINTHLDYYLKERSKINDKYFEYTESEDFRKSLEKHKEILDAYRKNNPYMTSWEMYANPDEEFDRYRESYEWIKCNTVYEFTDEAKKEIYNAFSILKTTPDKFKRPIIKILNKYDKDAREDIHGEIIGSIFSLDDARAIRDVMKLKYSPYGIINDEGDLVAPPYTENKEAYDSDANLIKNVPQTPIFKESLFTDYLLENDERTTEVRIAKRKLYTKINDILKKGIDKQGIISAKVLAENCSTEELAELASLYDKLRELSKKANKTYEEDNAKKEKEDKDRPFDYNTNSVALYVQYKDIINTTGTTRALLERIFYEYDKKGNIIMHNKLPVGNKFIYGYIDLKKNAFKEYTPEAKKYIDEKKTNARKLIEDNIEYVTTEYYERAKDAARAKGENYYKEWYEANHIYNPYSHKDEPIMIWTTMKAKPTGSLKAKADYVATKDNQEKLPRKNVLISNNDGVKIRKDTKNPLYSENVGTTYNINGDYTNSVYTTLNDTEREIKDKLEKIAWQFAITDYQKRFLNKGYAPRVYEKDTDWVDSANDILNIFGIGKRNYADKDWHQDVDFEHDFDINFNMYNLLKAKGYKKVPKLRDRALNESAEKYEEYKQEYAKEVKAIHEHNKQLDSEVLSRNWKEVYKKLINEGNNFLAKNRMKDLLYLTLQDLRQRKAYSNSTRFHFSGDLVKNKKLSTIQDERFYEVEQTRAIDTFQNWIRRFLFDEYTNYTKGRKIADRIQTANSAKFMMFNLMSGINNIAVGRVNIAMEGFAKDFFSNSQYRRGMLEYTKNVAGMVNYILNDEISNETVAIFDMFNIEDYDRSQNAFKDFKTDKIEKFNDVAYGFLSSGEHFMRNSTLLAMLDSHKIYEDPVNEGKYLVGTEAQYLEGIEIAALKQVLKDFSTRTGDDASFYRSMLDYFNNTYILRLREDKRTAQKLDRRQQDIVNLFVRSNYFKTGTKEESVRRRKEFIEAYLKVKNDLIKDAKTKFSSYKTVRECITFDEKEKREKIIEGSNLTLDHIAELTNEAINVNKKIHGVYDKLGAAKIERATLGSLIMQYKKHLYPGFMKHWGRKGYYNEYTKTNEYGMFWSVFDWLTTDFRYQGSINDHWANGSTESDAQVAQKSIVNLFRAFINNALDLGINYKLLPDWQKRNIKRFAGDIGGILVSLGVIMAIYAIMDGDDLKESTWANEVLYLADRLYGESTMYGMLLSGGLWTEFSNFKDKPIVAMDYIYDAMKMWGYIAQYASNPEGYEPNYKRGTYKGENKMWVTIRKNIPAYRQYQQLLHITSHNNYYKANELNFAQSLFKNLGIGIQGNWQNNDQEPFYTLNR